MSRLGPRRRRGRSGSARRCAIACGPHARGVAESKTLLADMEAAAHELGVVGESAGVRAVYLVCASRFIADNAARLLRLGAPASGKNLVVEKVLQFIPKAAVVQISGSKPKRPLAYYGGKDPDALKHKIVYIQEAQIMAAKRDVESEFAIMLRTLISEGRVVYQTVVLQEGGPPATVTIVKNGPIAAVITTARDVDPELKTRVMVMDTDETGAQTVAIVKRILSKPKAKPDLKPWLDLQTWLELDAPYRVEVPFKEAIFQAFERERPGFLKGVALRIRRDLGNFISAIEASAVAHKAQREVNQDGAIVATLDDYRHAHEAFDEGLATVHGKASEKVTAVVTAIEAMQIEDLPDLPVKMTMRELAKRLRVASPMTARARLAAALELGVIEQDDAMSGRGGARYYKVLKTEAEILAAPGPGAYFPRWMRCANISMAPPPLAKQLDKLDKRTKRRILSRKRRGNRKHHRHPIGLTRYERVAIVGSVQLRQPLTYSGHAAWRTLRPRPPCPPWRSPCPEWAIASWKAEQRSAWSPTLPPPPPSDGGDDFVRVGRPGERAGISDCALRGSG